jgi:type II secretory pathway component GspD/PulD (secretin)
MRMALCRLFAAAVFVAPPALFTTPAQAAAPAPAVPAKNASPMDAARKALDEVGDMSYQNQSLNAVISDLKDKAKVAVVIDPMVFQFGFDPNQPTINVNLKGVKLKDGLQQALAPFGLKCGLTRDGLFISTEEGVIAKQLRQRVSVDCDGTAFAAAVKQLAADTGANVVIDPRLKEKASAAVTLKLDDVPLETAVRLLAEVADLGTVRMNNVLFVTTTERAEKLRPNADGPTQPGNNPLFPIIGGAAGPVIGGVGGIAPLPAVPAPPAQKAEEKEPEKKP